MQRKKISTGTNNAAAMVELDDDEQLVEEVTTTKRIGRQRREKAAEPDIITVEAEETDDDEVNPPEFSDTSLAALIYGDGDEPLENQYCTVAIRRNPDSMNDRFLTPCGAITNLPPMRNVELTAERMDIEERVRVEFGGGHYFFQLHFNNRLQSSWKSTLSDDPAAVARAHAEKVAANMPTPPAPVAAAPPDDPMTTLINNLTQTKQLRDLLFGETEERLKDEIERLKIEAANRPATVTEPQSETLVILEKALSANSPELTERLLDYVFPAKDENGRHWIADIIDVAIKNKDVLMAVAGPLLGLGSPPAPQTDIASLMRSQPPGELPPPPASGFRRREPKPPETDGGLTESGSITPERVTELSELADDIAAGPQPEAVIFSAIVPRPGDDFTFSKPDVIGEVTEPVPESHDADADAATDAEIIEEVPDAKPKRRSKNAGA